MRNADTVAYIQQANFRMDIVNAGGIFLEAPCKVNLSLNIGERRRDGFHDIESIFAAFSLNDTLQFEALAFNRLESRSAVDEVSMDTGGLPPELGKTLSVSCLPPGKNLVLQAIKLFKRKTGFDRSIRACVYKRIPPAAGLGGGSSDAAAALWAMYKLSGQAVSVQKLLELAALLGSDIPFFVSLYAGADNCEPQISPCSAAFVYGRGECMEPLSTPLLDIVIVNSGIESGTKQAFTLLDNARLEYTADKAPQKHLSKADLLSALQKKPADWPFCNDFLPVFLETPPQNKIYKAMLHDLTMNDALFCGLSGSGSSCFGVFADAATAKSAAASLAKDWPFVRQAHSF
jgi:4-diphosphocytidyl-2-C-methyl-D-erythritol kinase